MLKRTLHLVVASLAAAGCTGDASSTENSETDDTAAQTASTSNATSTTNTTAADSATETDNTSTTDSSSGGTGGSGTTRGSSESTTGTPVDRCRPGVGVDWPRRGAYLKLATEEDFAAGPLELSCSIERALIAKELEPLFPSETVGGIELSCAIPDGEGSSPVFVAVSLPDAVPSLHGLVGREDVVASFSYGGPSEGGGKFPDLGVDAIAFGIRDEVGPLFLSQEFNCEGPIEPRGLTCDLLRPPFMISPTWSDPLPEPTLADVGCGTRAWDYNLPPMPGVYDMNRLAVRFETDDGVVDAVDHLVTPLNIEGSAYDFFATEAVGEVDDPDVFLGSTYHHYVRFLIIRTR